jgi:hypothetical protein
MEDNYVIVTPHKAEPADVIVELEQQFRALQSRTSWNARGLFLVLVSDQYSANRASVRRILELLWQFNALNALLVVPETTKALNLYTWFPYQSHELCIQVQEVMLDSWTFEHGGRFKHKVSLFPPKMPSDLKGCNINVTTLEFQPCVMLSDDGSSEVSLKDGLEVRLYLLIIEKLNMTFKLKLSGTEKWGSKLPNNSWTGMKGLIYERTADVAFGALLLEKELCTVFDCTNSYLITGVSWYVPRAKKVDNWRSLYRVFTPAIWLVFFVVCVVVALLLWQMAKLKSGARMYNCVIETSSYSNFSNCLSNVWAAMVGVSVSKMPVNFRLRILFLLWLFYCTHMNVVYLSFLSTFLIHPGFQHQVRNVEELLESGMEYGYNMGFDKYFTDPTDWRLVNILAHRRSCGREECLDRMATGGDFAVLAADLPMQYLTTYKYLDSRGQSVFYTFQDQFVGTNFVMYLTKGSPLLVRMNRIIRSVVEAGLLTHWFSEMKTSSRLSHANLTQEEDATLLTLSHLQPAFTFLMFELGICVAVFVAELIWFYCCRRNFSE